MKYLKMTGFIILFLAVYFILSNYITVIAAVFMMLKVLFQDPSAFAEPGGDAAYNLMMEPLMSNIILLQVIGAAISLPIYVFIYRLRKERLIRTCEFRIIPVYKAVLAALLGIGLNFVVSVFVSATSLDKLSPEHEELMSSLLNNTSFAVTLLGVGILIPVFEEILFRGIVFNELKRNMRVLPALILQAVIFGAFHMNLTQAIYTSILAIALGLVYIWTKSLWGPILIHIFLNSTSAIISNYGSEQFLESYGSILILASIAIVIIAFVVLPKSARREARHEAEG